jgi:acyl carrier protein
MTTTRDQRILAGVKNALNEKKVADIEGINLETDLVKDRGLDSLDSVEIVMGLEDEFKIEIPEEATKGKDFVLTVGAIVKIVDKLLPKEW